MNYEVFYRRWKGVDDGKDGALVCTDPRGGYVRSQETEKDEQNLAPLSHFNDASQAILAMGTCNIRLHLIFWEKGDNIMIFKLLDCRNHGILHIMLGPEWGSRSLATLDIFTKCLIRNYREAG